MRKIVALVFVASGMLWAQGRSSALFGVWKADLQKSNFAGPPGQSPTNYLEIIEDKTVVVNQKTQEKANEVDERSGTWSQRGHQRALLAFIPGDKPYIRIYHGVPTRMTASWEGSILNLKAETAGRPQLMKRTYELSPDGQTLTIHSLTTGAGPEPQESTIVLVKQPDSAGDPLRQPEELAGQHFKNVKTEALKGLPESQFIDRMQYYAWSLGKNCEFCHVKGHFDSDDKKEKKTARDMTEMTASIQQNNFKGKPEVQCFTCHEGHNKPLTRPLFPDEPVTNEAPPGPGAPKAGPGGPGAGGAGPGAPTNDGTRAGGPPPSRLRQ